MGSGHLAQLRIQEGTSNSDEVRAESKNEGNKEGYKLHHSINNRLESIMGKVSMEKLQNS
jgi:hypothetical protein